MKPAIRRFEHVAVLMGGPSSEREVSLNSGRAVARALAAAGYRVEPVDVTGRTLELPAGVEAVFIALHGEFGEDGQVQAELTRRGIPYTGSGADSSRRSFDKVISKRAFEAAGIPTAAYIVLKAGMPCSLPPPLVVKPSRQGSSVGIHRVFADTELPAALADAFRFDDTVLAEAFIAGRELTVGLLEGECLPVVEIMAPDAWYDYRSKYTSGVCRYGVPADIDAACAAACRRHARRAYDVLDCRGFARVDFRADAAGEVYILELNSIPGFTATSLLPKAAAQAGIAFEALCDRIMNGATC